MFYVYYIIFSYILVYILIQVCHFVILLVF